MIVVNKLRISAAVFSLHIETKPCRSRVRTRTPVHERLIAKVFEEVTSMVETSFSPEIVAEIKSIRAPVNPACCRRTPFVETDHCVTVVGPRSRCGSWPRVAAAAGARSR